MAQVKEEWSPGADCCEESSSVCRGEDGRPMDPDANTPTDDPDDSTAQFSAACRKTIDEVLQEMEKNALTTAFNVLTQIMKEAGGHYEELRRGNVDWTDNLRAQLRHLGLMIEETFKKLLRRQLCLMDAAMDCLSLAALCKAIMLNLPADLDLQTCTYSWASLGAVLCGPAAGAEPSALHTIIDMAKFEELRTQGETLIKMAGIVDIRSTRCRPLPKILPRDQLAFMGLELDRVHQTGKPQIARLRENGSSKDLLEKAQLELDWLGHLAAMLSRLNDMSNFDNTGIVGATSMSENERSVCVLQAAMKVEEAAKKICAGNYGAIKELTEARRELELCASVSPVLRDVERPSCVLAPEICLIPKGYLIIPKAALLENTKLSKSWGVSDDWQACIDHAYYRYFEK